MELTHHHATAFLDGQISNPLEQLRGRWDPVMARQIAAHVTLIYPEEIPSPADLTRLAASAAAVTRPFSVTLGSAFYVGSPARGVFLHVHDDSRGIWSFRAKAVPAGRATNFPPHVTLVHPRTSTLGQQAWQEVAPIRIDAQFAITHVAITALAEDRWQTLQLLPLGWDLTT